MQVRRADHTAMRRSLMVLIVLMVLVFSVRSGIVGGSADGAAAVPYDLCYGRSEGRCVEGFWCL